MNNQAGKKPRSSLIPLKPAVADAVAFIAGLLLPLAFSPFDLFPLAILCPALLFLVWEAASPGRAAFRGFLFGLGMFGVGVSWVYVSLHYYGNMPAPLAGLAVFLFVAGLSIYPALVGWLQAKFLPNPGAWHFILAIPALWVLAEWTRGWFLTGFPWLHLGYSQVATPLAGYAAWLGVYGISFLCAVSAGLLAEGMRTPAKFFRRSFPLLLLIWLTGWIAGLIEWTQPVNQPLRVALVQGNISLDSKWQPGSRRVILDRYWSLSEQAPPSDLIVWPESAIPAYLDEIDTDYLEKLRGFSQTTKVDFLIGVMERESDKRHYYNAVISLGLLPGIYRKQHLVPFGEYPPLDPLFRWLMRNLQIPMSDFSAGAPDQPLLTAAGQSIGVSVCYEDAFGEEVIRTLPQASLLVNVSEDAWFGDSLASRQRLQMARMRALETGRPMLRAANTGPSAVIGHRGEILAISTQFQVQVLTAKVQPMQGATPYVIYGNWLAVILVALIAVSTALSFHPFRIKPH
ncbi:MAG: apolipoprotein N-acyltransferase [Gammaproteobacteria bacterium]|nr:apolipoprotein N-acyltransferase [Gammaproteobacteria bacterium]MDH5487244.1 apolipoprotein N-acyltransferase [Gammaproteobacteria bacterium]